MAGGPASLEISALASLGFVKQTNGFGGTATVVPADALNWLHVVSNTLQYDIGEHLLETGSGTRGSETFAARGQSIEKGDIEWFLQPEQSAALFGYFFGVDSCAGSSPTSATTVASGGAAGANTVVLTSGTGYTAGLFFQVTHAATSIVETHKIASLSTNTVTLAGSETFLYACTAGDAVALVVAPFTHTLSYGSSPVVLTLEDQWTTQSYQLRDILLDQLDVTSSKTDWKAKLSVLGGSGDTAIASVTPTYGGDTNALQWGDTSALTLHGSVVKEAADAFAFTLKNNAQQFFGAGSYTATRGSGGKVQGTIKYTTLFDSAAAATAYANYVAGTETTVVATIGPVTANSQSGCQQVWTFPKARIMMYPKKYALDNFMMVDVSAACRQANGVTAAITNAEWRSYA